MKIGQGDQDQAEKRIFSAAVSHRRHSCFAYACIFLLQYSQNIRKEQCHKDGMHDAHQ